MFCRIRDKEIGPRECIHIQDMTNKFGCEGCKWERSLQIVKAGLGKRYGGKTYKIRMSAKLRRWLLAKSRIEGITLTALVIDILKKEMECSMRNASSLLPKEVLKWNLVRKCN